MIDKFVKAVDWEGKEHDGKILDIVLRPAPRHSYAITMYLILKENGSTFYTDNITKVYPSIILSGDNETLKIREKFEAY